MRLIFAVAAVVFGFVSAPMPASAQWFVGPGSELLPDTPSAVGPSQDESTVIAVTCLSGNTPIFILEMPTDDGPPDGEVVLAIDGRPYAVEARREDTLWIGTVSPRLVADLAAGIRLAAVAPGKPEVIISLRGSARAIGEVLTGCG
ncbi:MAG: hypothetical protein AAF675_11645 [Pseudomonadota bacterium]